MLFRFRFHCKLCSDIVVFLRSLGGSSSTSLKLTLFLLNRFEGVSWSEDEEYIAYVAEEPACPRPIFGQSASLAEQMSSDTLEGGAWTGQGDWMEDWGEAYSGQRRPVIFIMNVYRYSDARTNPNSWR